MADNAAQLRTYDGAVAIITGGASGIGKALGEELAARGCEVVLADRQFDAAQSVAVPAAVRCGARVFQSGSSRTGSASLVLCCTCT